MPGAIVCHQGSLAIPRGLVIGGWVLLVILSRSKWWEGDGRVGKREAWQAEARALLG